MKASAQRSHRIAELSLLTPLITAVIVIAGLYYGRAVLIPLALALLLSFLLAPPVSWLEQARLGRIPSVLVTVLVTCSALGGLLWVGATELADILNMIPSYEQNIHRKIEAMRNPAGSALAKAADSLATLSADLSGTEGGAPPSSLRPSSRRKTAQHSPDNPVPVELVKHKPGIVESIGLVGMSIAHFVELTAGVLVLTVFMLAQRGDLRNRVFRLFGQGHLNVITTALDDATQRVSKYLLTQLLVNGTFGLLLGLGLWWIGVPYAPFWGALGAVLRFVPYIGSAIAGICPLLLALAVFEGWTQPLLTFGLFATVEVVVSSAIEPWLYGAHTGLSSLAILVSAAFWTLLWGPIGLILSTPLTVCLLVMGRHVPSLSSISILLGDQPVLPPEACYYQRLLAGDEDEAQEVVEEYLKDHSPADLYDSVLIPALSLAEQDRHATTLDEERTEFIYQTTKTVIEELESQAADQGCESGQVAKTALSIACSPARDKADEVVGFMLRDLLRACGHDVQVIPVSTRENMIAALARQSPDIVFISALPPLALSHARLMCRRLRRSSPAVKIIVGVWNAPAEKLKADARWEQGTCDLVITTLREAQHQVSLLADAQEVGKIAQPLETAVRYS